MKIILLTLSVLYLMLSYNSYAANATGPATVYKITMQKIELCTSVTLTDEHDTTCNGAVVVGSGNKTFDIASVSAGSQVGSYVSTSGLPIGTTFTHARPTISREFTIKGYATVDGNCSCRTESDATYDSTNGKYKTVQYGKCEANAATAAANAEENLMWIGTDTGTNGTVICGNAACDTNNGTTSYSKDNTSLNYQYGLSISDPDVSTDNFTMIFKLETPYTVGLTAPKIELAFGTANSLYANEYSDGNCFVDAYFPRSTTTISE